MNPDLERQLEVSVLKDKFEKPRWKNGPHICELENLPAFPSKEAAIAWLDAPKAGNPLYESRHVEKIWLCHYCGEWHFKTKPRPPSGSSSGTGRES